MSERTKVETMTCCTCGTVAQLPCFESGHNIMPSGTTAILAPGSWDEAIYRRGLNAESQSAFLADQAGLLDKVREAVRWAKDVIQTSMDDERMTPEEFFSAAALPEWESFKRLSITALLARDAAQQGGENG